MTTQKHFYFKKRSQTRGTGKGRYSHENKGVSQIPIPNPAPWSGHPLGKNLKGVKQHAPNFEAGEALMKKADPKGHEDRTHRAGQNRKRMPSGFISATSQNANDKVKKKGEREKRILGQA